MHLKLLKEPHLEFRYGQNLCSPHDGLVYFGPFDADQPSRPAAISYGLVSTSSGRKAFSAFCERIQKPIYVEEGRDERLWPLYPGFEAIFNCKLPLSPSFAHDLDEHKINMLSLRYDQHDRVGSIVDLYLEGIKRIASRDEITGAIVCIVPDVIFKNCRTQSRISDGTGSKISPKELKARKAGFLSLFEDYNTEYYKFSVDFRRQIKARAMEYGIPIQIIRERTLSLELQDGDEEIESETGFEKANLTFLSDRAWNLSVGLYYKCGGKPWKLSTAREGVCYVGIAYHLTGKPGSSTACCAAQMFLEDGDGIVFKGDFGPWYSKDKKEFHLPYEAAKSLLAGAIKSYKTFCSQPLKEIFLHCHSSIDDEEFSGFKAACSDDIKIYGIRVRKCRRGGLKLYNSGSKPVPRGTLLVENSKKCFLWASGYKSRLGTYDGWEVPIPLEIDIQQGCCDIEQVAVDILGLTKLNYNACRLGDSEPVTVLFSQNVGEILVSNPTVIKPDPRFKFYI